MCVQLVCTIRKLATGHCPGQLIPHNGRHFATHSRSGSSQRSSGRLFDIENIDATSNRIGRLFRRTHTDE